ncbi:hypothetical protein HK102_011073 [Quaeritorhiza haematococci]|nr:hypothetical protein HK102_011073 [Quaeritorhiza haematococci]
MTIPTSSDTSTTKNDGPGLLKQLFYKCLMADASIIPTVPLFVGTNCTAFLRNLDEVHQAFAITDQEIIGLAILSVEQGYCDHMHTHPDQFKVKGTWVEFREAFRAYYSQYEPSLQPLSLLAIVYDPQCPFDVFRYAFREAAERLRLLGYAEIALVSSLLKAIPADLRRQVMERSDFRLQQATLDTTLDMVHQEEMKYRDRESVLRYTSSRGIGILMIFTNSWSLSATTSPTSHVHTMTQEYPTSAPTHAVPCPQLLNRVVATVTVSTPTIVTVIARFSWKMPD